MKTYLSIVAFVLLSFSSRAQYNHMVGINTTSFVKNFLSFNDQSPASSPFQFTYRKLNENKATRIILGLNISNTTVGEDDDKSIIGFQRVNLRVGRERRISLSNRWLMYWGGDVILNFSNSTSKNESGGTDNDFKTTITTLEGGLGLVLGVQFNITDRLSLGTEGGLPLTYLVQNSKSVSGNNESSSESSVFSLTPQMPSALFLQFQF